MSQSSFTTLPSERFSLSAAFQYYHSLDDLSALVEYIRNKVCTPADLSCHERISTLHTAGHLDIDFDTISHALTLAAFWPAQIWDLSLTSNNPNDRLEVGILSNEKPTEPEELSLAGFLTIVGEDTSPSPTLFSFPARHHAANARFSSRFILPTGLHPSLQLDITDATPPVADQDCTIHAHLTLPRAIFADKYQLSDPLFLASKNLSAVHHITSATDLEAPAYALDIWGSTMLLELVPPTKSTKPQSWTAEVPLHLRYLSPDANSSGIASLDVPAPVLFWACVADEGSKFPINPFDRINLGYDGLFGPKTMFYHLAPDVVPNAYSEEAVRLVNVVEVPILDLSRSRWVEVGTATALMIGFLGIMWSLLRVLKHDGYGRLARQKREEISVVKKSE